MAWGVTTGGGIGGSGLSRTTPVSGSGNKVLINSDAETATSAANLLRPHNAGAAAIRWVKVKEVASRVWLRGIATDDLTAIGTSPVVQIWGAIGGDPTVDDESDITYFRIDNANPAATGVTLTFAGSPSTTTSQGDGTNWISQRTADYDLLGAEYVTVLVETAASTTGTGTVGVEGVFI